MSRIIKIRPNYIQVAAPQTTQKSFAGAIAPNGSFGYQIVTGGPQPTAPSPTGRNPTFIWTPERQYMWNQMVSTNHWVYQLANSEGSKSGTATQRYGDLGVWAAWMFQVTGNTTWAQKAYSVLNVQPNVSPDDAMGGANGIRENFTIACIVADWIYPGLTAQQKTDIFSWLTVCANFARAFNTSQYKGGFSDADTDQTTGSVGGLLLLSLLDLPENSANYDILQGLNVYLASNPGVSVDTPIGGYTATGANNTTKRNRLRQLATVLAAGGEWMESSEYNTGTTRLLVTLTAAMRTALAGTEFDSEMDYIVDLAKLWRHRITYDTQAIWQWGEEQNPDSWPSEYRRNIMVDSMMCIQGTLVGYDNTQAAYLSQTIANALAYDPAQLYKTTNAIQRGILLYDNTVVPAAAPVPEVCESFGQGFVFHRRATCNTYLHACKYYGQHHGLRMGAGAQMYRNGGWVLNHPIGYGTYPTSAIGYNSVLLNGLIKDCITRTIRLSEQGADWYALTNRNSGRLDDAYVYGGPPPAFMNYWERRMVSIPSGAFDCIVIQDTVNGIQDPATLSGFQYYLSTNQTLINNKFGMFCPIIHTNVSPTQTANYLTWTAPNGDTCRFYTLTPSDISYSTIDQLATNFGGSAYVASQKKYHTLIKKTTEATDMVFLHVFIVGSGTFPSVTNTGDSQVDIGSRQVIFNANSTTVT